MTYVESAARSIAPVLKKGALVILESTSPVGSTEKMAEWLAEMRPDLTFPQQVGEQADVNIAYCPERVLPGQVMVELIKNDRVIGGMTPVCSARASELYKIFLEGECVVTNSRTAEMCKLTENSFRDVNIAFANELSLICADQGINVWELIRLANRHPRVNILQPGPGVGGHCIAQIFTLQRVHIAHHFGFAVVAIKHRMSEDFVVAQHRRLNRAAVVSHVFVQRVDLQPVVIAQQHAEKLHYAGLLVCSC